MGIAVQRDQFTQIAIWWCTGLQRETAAPLESNMHWSRCYSVHAQ